MEVDGFRIPLFAGIVRSIDQVALSLGCNKEKIQERVHHGIHNPIEPILLSSGPCQEVVIPEEDVDLTIFPLILHHERDGGPYINSAVQLAQYGDHALNAGMYRHMFRTKNTLGIDLNSPSDLRYFYSLANAQGRPIEMAAAIGLYPTEMIAATYNAPLGTNEMAIAGGLRGEPVEMVKCKSIDVEVPANAEIVLECEILPGGWAEDEGRFGEFHGITGTMKKNPIVRVKKITHRHNPIYYTILMVDEVSSLGSPLLEAQDWNSLKTVRLRPKAVRATKGGCSYFQLYVSLHDPQPGEGQTAVMALLSLMGVKFVTVVDDDIDIYNEEEMSWALSLRVQPDQDVTIVRNVQAKHMDPTVRAHHLPKGQLPTTSKMGIDATIPPDISRSEYERAVIFKG